MKKIIMLFIISLSIISLHSCKYIESDEDDIYDVYVVYNESKYYRLTSKGQFNFIGNRHKAGIYLGLMGYRHHLYCLDSDVEENILFDDGFPVAVYIKEGYEFNEEAIIDSIEITNDKQETTILEIENCNFSNLFIKTYEMNLEFLDGYLHHPYVYITLKYGENIEWSCYLVLLDDDNLYSWFCIYDHEYDKYYVFKLADEYQEEFKSYITELKTEDNVEE